MGHIKGFGVLDFVTAWYVKAARYLRGGAVLPLPPGRAAAVLLPLPLGEGGGEGQPAAKSPHPNPLPGGEGTQSPLPRAEGTKPDRAAAGTRCAFVSTNSITQGEQVGVLWGWLLAQGVHIHFAHRTFSWSNEARGKAAVHCVIIGFGLEDRPDKTIYEYDDIRGEPHPLRVSNISPYLSDTAAMLIDKRGSPISPVPEIVFGSKAVDFGHFVIEDVDLPTFLAREPQAKPYIRDYIGGEEFLNGTKRYCLWLKGIPPAQLRAMPEVLKRVEAVKQARLKSVKSPTRELAKTPTEFGEDRQPSTPYLLIPKVSSENRAYVPLGFFEPKVIINPSVLVVPGAGRLELGVLQSSMHMAWLRAVGGRLESRYQYSAQIVYNNFPWPTPLPSQNENSESKSTPASVGRTFSAIEIAAQGVLDARAQFQTGEHPATLADLYDPLTMPPALLKAHQKLDAAVDKAYEGSGGKKSYASDAERVAFLFDLYQRLTSLLPTPARPRRSRPTNNTQSLTRNAGEPNKWEN